MGFSGNPTVNVATQQIENDGFWPDLDLAEFQRTYRLPGGYLVDMLTADLSLAMYEVNLDLAALQARWKGAGVSNVESADTTVLPERTFQLALYKRAVFTRAKASILRQMPTVTRREVAENSGKEAPEQETTYLAFSNQAIRALQGRGRMTSRLL